MLGDHLSVHYKTFYHHGIDCGDGTVIHMSNDHGGIIRTSYNEFADGKIVHIETSPIKFANQTVVERAKSRVGEGGYHLFNNNCEHFVSWCRTDRQKSRQVKNVSKTIGKQMVKNNVQIGAKTLAHIGTKELEKNSIKYLAKSGAKSGGKVLTKTLAKGGVPFIIADVAQVGVEQLGGNLGLSQGEAEVAGKVVGAGGHVAAGAVIGGPLGAAAGFAIWGVGELFGSLFD